MFVRSLTDPQGMGGDTVTVTGFGGKHDDPYCYAREFIWNVENVGNTKTNWAEPEVQTKPQINAFSKFSPWEMELRCALEHSPILKSSFLID